MADKLQQLFSGSALPAGWTEANNAGGTVTVAGGILTLTIPAAAGARAAARSPVLTGWADGDTLTVKVNSSVLFQPTFVLRQGLADTDMAPAITAVNANWRAGVHRVSTGYGSDGASVSRPRVANPWLRFVRTGANSVTAQCAPDVAGVPGAWLDINTDITSATGWTPNWDISRVELLATSSDTASSTSFARVGDGTVPVLATDLQLRFSAGEFFADTVVMPEATGVVPDFVEDFSAYTTGADLYGTPPGGTGQHTGPFGGDWVDFNVASVGGSFALANEGVNINGLALTQSLRVNFPDSTASVGTRCDNFTMRPSLRPLGAAFNSRRSMYLEMYVKFSSTWTVRAPDAWGCANNPDHKTWLMNTIGGSGRWEVKIGAGVFPDGTTAVKVGDPALGEDRLTNVKLATNTPPDPEIVGDNYWDNQWHTIRVHIDLGGAGTGVYRVWLDGVLIHETTGMTYNPAITGFDAMQMGANRNVGQSGAMDFSWGLVRIYNTNPGW